MTEPEELDHAMQTLRQGGWDGICPALVVSGRRQRLYLLKEGAVVRGYTISTAKNGFGNMAESGCTPTGLHRICACIGAEAPLGSVFKAREPTGEIVCEAAPQGRDCITSRILWLEGLEPGVNLGEGVDSRNRTIYIHGTPNVALLGTPASAGCVRMKDAEVAELFPWVDETTLVVIVPD